MGASNDNSPVVRQTTAPGQGNIMTGALPTAPTDVTPQGGNGMNPALAKALKGGLSGLAQGLGNTQAPVSGMGFQQIQGPPPVQLNPLTNEAFARKSPQDQNPFYGG